MTEQRLAAYIFGAIVVALLITVIGIVLTQPSDMVECINKGGTYYDNSEGTACTFGGEGL